MRIKLGSQYDTSQRIRKNRTNFYSSVWVQTGAHRHASVGNGSEPASSELRVATRHIVNLALVSSHLHWNDLLLMTIPVAMKVKVDPAMFKNLKNLTIISNPKIIEIEEYTPKSTPY